MLNFFSLKLEIAVRFELTIKVLQTHELPLHYAIILVPVLGFEPRTSH